VDDGPWHIEPAAAILLYIEHPHRAAALGVGPDMEVIADEIERIQLLAEH
jgi:hypothetical protein